MTTDMHQPEPRSIQQWLQLALPILIVGVVAVYLLMMVGKVAGTDDGLKTYDYRAFGAIPVSEGGRVKPLDTVARYALLQISGKQSLTDEMLLDGERADRPAVVWLAEVMAQRAEARQRKVFRIDDPDVLGLLGKTSDDGKFYSLSDIFAEVGTDDLGRPVLGFNRIVEQSTLADAVATDERSRFEEHVLGLARNLRLFDDLTGGLRPYTAAPEGADQDWEPVGRIEPGMGLVVNERAVRRESARSWSEVVLAYGSDDAEGFNRAVTEHRRVIAGVAQEESSKASFEQGFNAYRPFAMGIVLYTLSGIIALLGLLFLPILSAGWYRSVWRTGTGVLIVTLLLHTAALVVRMWLQGRPPVTNLYSSAIFIGWAVVLFAVVMELLSRMGIASLASSIVGVATLFIAHNLAKDGDTMGVMQAVLDSNFWLGTHVITVTLGYAATFLAGFLAILYIVLGMFTPILGMSNKKPARLLTGMVYGVVCFALLFSFVGTVLGGIWADQSWGRFWGWDPKENGAIMIVLINAIILHARWGHLVKDRGIMVLAIGGNIITAWSWFGTNLLGVGLHSYGFMDGAMQKLGLFAVSQLLIMALAMSVPTRYWCSFRKKKPRADRGARDVAQVGV